MPNKKNPKNGFYFFMKDVQEDVLVKQGRTVAMKDLPAIAHPRWKDLPEAEKEVYNNMAKEWKQKQRGTLEGKLDCTGAPIARALKEEKEDEDRTHAIVRSIKRHLKLLGLMNAVAREKFYIISMNIFCQTEEGIFVPAEVGLIEYSIAEGITKTFHYFIDPGELPTGYTFSCKQMSEEVHKIPIQKFDQASNNYMFMWNKIKLFVNPTKQSGNYPPVYAFSREMEQVEGCLSWLHRKSSDYSDNPFVVSDLAVLLLEMRMFAAEQGGHPFVSSGGLAEDILTRNVFDYVPNICCKWHDEQDVSNCAVGVVKRYAYLLSDYLCEVYDVEMIPERHLPLREQSETISFIEPSFSPTDVKPVQNKLDAPYKVTKHQFSDNLVTNFKSKYDTSEEKIVIPGASAGVRSEMPAAEKPHTPTVASTPWSAANVVKGANADFKLMEDEFPSLSLGSSGPRPGLPTAAYAQVASPVGVGRGRGMRFLKLQEVPNVPKQLQYVGIGRALTLGERNVQLGHDPSTKP